MEVSNLPRAPYPTNPRPYFYRMTAPQKRQYALDRMRADPRRTSIVSTACYLFGWEMTADLFKLHPWRGLGPVPRVPGYDEDGGS